MPLARSVPSDLSVLKKKSLLFLERLPGVTSRFSQSNHSEAGRNKPIEGNPRVFQEFLAPLESRLRPAETHQRQPLSPLRNRAKATRKNRKVDSTGKVSQDDNNRRSTRRTGFGMREARPRKSGALPMGGAGENSFRKRFLPTAAALLALGLGVLAGAACPAEEPVDGKRLLLLYGTRRVEYVPDTQPPIKPDHRGAGDRLLLIGGADLARRRRGAAAQPDSPKARR